MRYKFEDLEVWQLSLELLDLVYEVAEKLSDTEKFNLMSQIIRAGTSVGLNIAEGSTSQSDAEQTRFLGYSIRSLVEVIACLRIIERRNYIADSVTLKGAESLCNKQFIKLQAFRNSLK